MYKIKHMYLLLSEVCGFKLFFMDTKSQTLNKSDVDELCIVPPHCSCTMNMHYIDIY